MAYGTVKVNYITFDEGAGDVTISVPDLRTALTSGVTVTGTISAQRLTATSGVIDNISGINGNITSISGTSVVYTSGEFTTLSGATITATTISGAFSGNASTATKLSSSRTFELTGDISGSVSSDLTSGASISTSIASGSIVDADVNASAGIALSKLATGALPTGITVASDNLVDGTIVNADINASAAIVDTKLATISTAGKVDNSATTATSSNTADAIVARDANGDIGVTSINSGPLAGFRNAIINGQFAIAQRGTSFEASANDDDSYNLDRWYVLSDGNDVVDITQETSVVPTDGKYALALDVETTNKKFGIAQIIENDNCIGLIGGTVTLSFKAKVSATTKLDNVKAAIVAWSGTADSVTSDIISAWNAEDTNPTLIANATYENTPANLNVTTSYATYSVTATVDTASAANIILLIWSDVTDTTLGDFLYITDVQLEQGPIATPFEQRPIGAELALCQRYYCKMDDSDLQGGALTRRYANGGVTHAAGGGNFPVEMRTTPTATIPTITYTNGSGLTLLISPRGAAVRVLASGAVTFLWTSSDPFTFDAEL